MASSNSISRFDVRLIDPAIGNYFAGLTDGEGCFYIRVGKQRDGDPAPQVAFSLQLRYDDVEILELFRKTLQCGRLKVVNKRQEIRKDGKTRNDHPCYIFIVNNTNDLISKVIPFFETFPLRAKKRRDLIVWKKAVELAYDVRKRTKKRGRTRWGPGDIKDFHAYIECLRQTRRPENSGRPIPLPKTKEQPRMRGLFF